MPGAFAQRKLFLTEALSHEGLCLRDSRSKANGWSVTANFEYVPPANGANAREEILSRPCVPRFPW